jgi:hypothetical protein
MPTMLEEPALYVPRLGAVAIECTICNACVIRMRCGDRALRELVELRLLIGTADAA